KAKGKSKSAPKSKSTPKDVSAAPKTTEPFRPWSFPPNFRQFTALGQLMGGSESIARLPAVEIRRAYEPMVTGVSNLAIAPIEEQNRTAHRSRGDPTSDRLMPLVGRVQLIPDP